MTQPTNYWKLGLFVVMGFILTLSAIALLGARALRKDVVRYVSYFDESVQGLEVGSPIKFRGVTIGTVGKIDVAPDHRMVEVSTDLGVVEMDRLGLSQAREWPQDKKAKRLLGMETDMRIHLASMGLTGVKFLELDFFAVADNPPPPLSFAPPDNYIPSAPSTMKSLEDAMVHVMQRMPEIADRVQALLTKVDTMIGELQKEDLSGQAMATLGATNKLLAEAQRKIEQVDTGAISKEAQSTLAGLNETVTRMNRILVKVDADKGLLGSVLRTSDALGDSAHEVDGLGSRVQDTLEELQDAARSIKKLADTLERDPDMLLKGRARAPVKNR